MFETLKGFFSGEVWLGFSKDDTVGEGKYKFTVGQYSILGMLSNVISVGKTYQYNGYTVDILDIQKTDDGKVLIYVNTVTAPPTKEAGALAWGLILGGIGAAILLSSIEKIEKLIDTTTTRAIQLALVVLTILIVWKFARKK